MSRVSLGQRIAAVREAAMRIDPYAVAVHSLPPALRQRYDLWRSENERQIAEVEARDGPGGAYTAMIDGTLVSEPMPSSVARALNLSEAPLVPADASAAEVAVIYAAMIDG